MEVLRFPNPILFTPCKEVTVFGPELLTLFEAMRDTMKAERGIGIAANQVGLSHRMIVMESKAGGTYFIANPVIVKKSIAPANVKEGCLSAPGEILLLPERVEWVVVEFFNEKGEKKRAVFSGVQSVCAQHEIDHLDGKSYLKSPSLPKGVRRELAKKWSLK